MPAAPPRIAERAGHALVEVARPRLEQVAEQLRLRQPRRSAPAALPPARSRSATAISPQWSGSVEGEQPRLERDERDRMRGAHRAAQHAAGVGVQAARDVEREHRAALAVRVLDERGVLAGDVAREADAEQAVDDQRPRVFAASAPVRETTSTRKNFSSSRAATTRASPPLLPGPASTRMSLPLSPASVAASSAAAAPARSISGRLGLAGGALDAPDVLAQVDRTMHASIVRERLLPQWPSMPPLRSLRAVPRALANWAGLAGQRRAPGRAHPHVSRHAAPRSRRARARAALAQAPLPHRAAARDRRRRRERRHARLQGRADLRRRPAQQCRGRLSAAAPAGDPGDVLRLPGPGGPRALAVDARNAPPPLAPEPAGAPRARARSGRRRPASPNSCAG